MPATYEPIATYTVSSTDTAITFSSIPQTYTDIKLILNGVSSTSNTQWIKFNNNSNTLYSFRQVYYDGTSPAASAQQNNTFIGIAGEIIGASTTYPTISIIDIFSYTTSYNKSFILRESWTTATQAELVTKVGLFSSLSNISTINLGRTGGTWNAGTIATIYGIKRA